MLRYRGAFYHTASFVRLWRAAHDDTVVQPTCFAASKEDARVYHDVPGFGGPNLYTTVVQPRSILHLYGDEDEALETLSRIYAVWLSETEGRAVHPDEVFPGAIAPSEWLMEQPYLVDAVADAGYDWIVVRDIYPDDMETWVWVGSNLSENEPELEEYCEERI